MPRDLSIALLACAALIHGCGDDVAETTGGAGSGAQGGAGGAGGGGGAAPEPGPEFDRFCEGRDWSATLEAATSGALFGEYVGALQNAPIVAGTMEGQKFVPEHPFHVTSIRAAFVGAPGRVRVRLLTTLGRSFPWPWPDTSDISQDLMPPVELDVSAPDPETWVEIDVADAGVFLLPTQHYLVVYEHLQNEPLLAVEGVPAAEREPERDYGRAAVFFPNAPTNSGSIGGTPEYPSVNYRVELVGEHFCAFADRWFELSSFTSLFSQSVTVADIDGDVHDDIIVYPNDLGARAFLGDGTGSFTEASWDVFGAAPDAGQLVFADIDNDGDRDAFAPVFALVDGDGDGFDILTEADCNDADPAVKPSANEVASNGRDDDCDGTTDDGMATSDGDGDGVSIAAGDCDDTLATMLPNNPEKLDGLDNDCDYAIDEDQYNRMLRNDGTGHFTEIAATGVEAIDPTASAAFADADADGVLDLYWGNWLTRHPGNNPSSAAVQDRFVIGNGDGTFTEATESAGMLLPTAFPALDVLWNDYDDDGDQDLLVGNYLLKPNQLWQNQGDGTFIDVADALGIAQDAVGAAGGHTFGADFGDIDGDGDIDFYISNLSHPRYLPDTDPSQMLISQGVPGFAFEDRRESLGLVYDEGDGGVQFADFDNDMDLDLVVTSLYEAHFSRLYRNDGAGFVDVTYETGTAIRDAITATWSDVDEDGDLDLLVSDRGGAPYVHLFMNHIGQNRAWVMLELEGTTTNRDAIGARATIVAKGVTQFRDVRGGANRGANQPTHWLHFGLDDATAIDSITVRWVGGATETFTGAAPGGRYRLVEGSGVAVELGASL